MKMTQTVYKDAKKLFNNGNSVKDVVRLSGLGDHTVRLIQKSKNWKSYIFLVKYNHTTVAQRSLMRKGFTKKEAKAMVKRDKAYQEHVAKHIDPVKETKPTLSYKWFLVLEIVAIIIAFYLSGKLLKLF